MDKDSSPIVKRHWWYWFDPRGKSAGSYGFMVNRIAGLGLTLYLFLHLVMLSKLIAGEVAFTEFIELAHTPIIIAGEFLVVLAVFLHGFNGLRIAATSLGVGSGVQKTFLLIVALVGFAGAAVFAIRMFGGG